jgi:hypothetical protein
VKRSHSGVVAHVIDPICSASLDSLATRATAPSSIISPPSPQPPRVVEVGATEVVVVSDEAVVVGAEVEAVVVIPASEVQAVIANANARGASFLIPLRDAGYR